MTTHHSDPNPEKKRPADAIDNAELSALKKKIFASKDPEMIARSLQKIAEERPDMRSFPFRAAMSMLTFYINMPGKDVDQSQKEILETAKMKLREINGRDIHGRDVKK